MHKLHSRYAIILSLFVLAGCIPDLITYQPPAAPTLSLTVKTKVLRFSWDLADDTLYYRIFENADGSSGFKQIAFDLAPTNSSYDHEIPAHLLDWDNARYLLEACNVRGCTRSNEVSTFGKLGSGIGYLKASNTDAGDMLGSAVAFSADGEYIAIGAPFEDSNSNHPTENQLDNMGPDTGAVYVFNKQGEDWGQDIYLKGGITTIEFGTSVALDPDANWLAVGSPENATNPEGLVFTFPRGASGFDNPINTVNPSGGGAADDLFGHSVALADADIGVVTTTFLAVGAIGRDFGANTNEGVVYLYSWNPNSSNWQSELTSSYYGNYNLSNDRNLGYAIDFSRDGKTLVAGSSSEEIYIFKYDEDPITDNKWNVSPAILSASNSEAGDLFGHAVAINEAGDTIVVGASNEAGSSLGINGADNNGAVNAGAAYVFTYNTTSKTWSQHSYIKASDTTANAEFGTSVDINDLGTIISVGAPGVQKIYNFRFNSTTNSWSQTTITQAPYSGPNDNFGAAISLSGDGYSLIAGANGEEGAGKFTDGDPTDNSAAYAGAAFLY